MFGSNLLGRKRAVHVGLISYPLYLWHWPLLSFAAITGVTSLQAKLAIIALSILLAELTTVLIEYPVRFGRLRQSGVSILFATMVAIIGCSWVIWRSGGFPSRYAREIQPVLATMQYDPRSGARVDECWLDKDSSFEHYSPDCGVGATLVWGDSHAARLYVGLKEDGTDIAQFTRDSCPPAFRIGEKNCAQSNTAILHKIAELKPKKVILFAAWSFHGENGPSDGAFAKTLASLKSIVDEVIVLEPAPLWSPDLPTQVYNYWKMNGRLPDRLQPFPTHYRKIDEAISAASAATNVRFISVFDALCNDEGCLTHTPESKTELISWDNGHLTIAGARFLAALLRLN